MGKGLSNLLIFLAGAGVGAGVTYYLVNEKANARADQEIADIRQLYCEKKDIEIDNQKNLKETVPKPEVSAFTIKEQKQYKEEITNYNTISKQQAPKPEEEEKEPEPEEFNEERDTIEEVIEVNDISKNDWASSVFDNTGRIYTIEPDQYGDIPHYDLKELYYYSLDDTVTDEEGTPIEDYESLIGPSSLNFIGEFETNVVYVRNDQHNTDYRVTMLEQTYSEPPERDAPPES